MIILFLFKQLQVEAWGWHTKSDRETEGEIGENSIRLKILRSKPNQIGNRNPLGIALLSETRITITPPPPPSDPLPFRFPSPLVARWFESAGGGTGRAWQSFLSRCSPPLAWIPADRVADLHETLPSPPFCLSPPLSLLNGRSRERPMYLL